MLKKVLRLDYILHLDSGLHIGGTDDSFDIGGADSTVLRNPLDNQPYIPGSTLKGKMKSLLKMKYGAIKENQILLKDIWQKAVFSPLEEKDGTSYIQVSRGIFRDAVLTDESSKKLQNYLGEGRFTEIKGENSIDLLKAKAANPRFIERVPAGAEFEGTILLQIFEGDDEEALKNTILEAMTMLESSYLGHSGSRGYGRIHFLDKPQFKEVEK